VIVNPTHLGLGRQSTRDNSLIRHDHHDEPAIPQSGNGPRSSRNQPDFLGLSQKMRVFDQHSIAIEKNGSLGHVQKPKKGRRGAARCFPYLSCRRTML